MECIYNINDSSWRVKVRYFEDGKAKYKNKSFKFKQYGSKQNALQAAKKYRDSLKNKMNTDNFIMPTNTSMDKMMEYKELLIPREDETNRKHWYIFKKHIKLDKPFEKVTAYDIQISLNKMVKDSSQDTIDRVFSVWKLLYRVAQLKRLDCQNRTLEVIVPKSEKICKKRELDYNDDLETLYSKIENYQGSSNYNLHLIVLALKTMYILGTRPGETFSLENSDIDLKKRTVLIKRTCDANGRIKRTKTYESYRVIPYPETCDELFKELKTYNNDIFIKDTGTRLCSNYVSNLLHKITNGNFREYMLRHRLATDLIIRHNTDPKTVQYIMGHKNVSQTLNYAISKEDKMRDAMQSRLY